MSKKKTTTKVEVKKEDVEVLNTPPKSNRKAYTKFMVDQQDKVKVMIPLSQGDPKGATHTFQINGATWTYPKNEMIDVPMAIAALISDRWMVRTSDKNLKFASSEKKAALS